MIWTVIWYPNVDEGKLDRYRCEVVEVDHAWQANKAAMDFGLPEVAYTLTIESGDRQAAFEEVRLMYSNASSTPDFYIG